jgi:hypothetical protein
VRNQIKNGCPKGRYTGIINCVLNWDYYQLGSEFLFVIYGNIMLTLIVVSVSNFSLVCLLNLHL